MTMTSDSSRLFHFDFSFPFKVLNTYQSCKLYNLTYYVGQRTVLDYTIVYDKAIGHHGRHILLAVKFYGYVRSSALDGFCREQSMTARLSLSINTLNTLSSVSKLIP